MQDKNNREKFLSEYEALCRKYHLIIDSQFDDMFLVIPGKVIDNVPGPIPGTGARKFEIMQVQNQSIEGHISHLRRNF